MTAQAPADTSADHLQTLAPLVIDGDEIETGDSFDVHDPGRPSQVVGRAISATGDQAERAVDGAARAWKDWSRHAPEHRAELLLAAIDGLTADAAARARILTRENGKVLMESNIEMHVFAGRCRMAAELAPELSKVQVLAPETQEPEPGIDANGRPRTRPPIPLRSEVSHLPLGVVTIIVPYNWPLAILAASLPYALVAGNTVIVKAPPATPLATTLVLRDLARRLPPGVLSVVHGSNDAVAPLIVDSRIRRLVFTGSTPAGQRMMEMCAGNLARVTLELGGNDPALVLDDADLDAAAIQRLTISSFLTTGQVCMGVKRIYVHRSRYDEVVEGMSGVLSHFRIGHGLDPQSSMGPLNNERQRDIVRQMLDEARNAGHEVREFGTLSDDAEQSGGWYMRPSLVLNPDRALAIVDQEQFGPSVPILPFDDLDPLVDELNDHWSGLTSSVWSGNPDRAASVARSLRTGTTWINNANAVAQDDRAPFGGFRASGVGRELGREGLFEFTEAHTITWPAA
ncbi:aldehyde dehydrogenase family protein [Altererythrobacter xixiisoli]|uniref:Aldehyde dehydrogenase family protein n=2 Tax=Croceibacterium xixiisoli TaxID=1476466 RepID=A0A6I4TW53_9SPHN|nr:aldehyde dehydrogenase family protein [Croceibacterium xixiisoli]